MSLRLPHPADASSLSRLHTASFDDGWTNDDFATWLSRSEAFAVIAEAGEGLAFGLALMAGADAELLTIATDPTQRQSGWGRQIFHALDAEALNRRLDRWVIAVARNNLPAIGLYKSAGFVEIGLRKAYYRTRDGQVDAFVMSRKVGPVSGQDGA